MTAITPGSPFEVLRAEPRWVAWRTERRLDKKTGEKKPTKVPYTPGSARHASVSDPSTWGTYEQAVAMKGCDGAGFMLTDHENAAAADLDHCLDPQTGILTPWAAELIEAADSYVELSPSGTGLHLWGLDDRDPAQTFVLPRGPNGEKVETYIRHGRYLTVTGKPFGQVKPLRDISLALRPLIAERDAARGTAREGAPEEEGAASVDGLPADIVTLIRHGAKPGADRSVEMFKVVGAMRRAGFARGKIVATLRAYPEGIAARCFERGRDDLARQVDLCLNKIDDEAARQQARQKRRAASNGPKEPAQDAAEEPVSLDDFWAYMPAHAYIFAPTRQLWPGASVNSRIPPVEDDGGNPIKASAWLDQNQPVEQMTWAPGQPMLVRDRLIAEGGWIERPGSTVFNLYRPPLAISGSPAKAKPWRDHLAYTYPDDADHIEKWLAHRVQRPAEKLNHALLLGGAPGIGKDTLLHPVRTAIGDWNMEEVTPVQLLGRFNSFIKSVILRINEARDLGEVNRYSFYEHTKPLIAAPPDTLRCDEKGLREYRVPNVCGVIITSNYKTDGLFLPADDRRHYVAWSHLTAQDFDTGHFEELYAWFEREGCRHVTAYLNGLSLAGFNPKAPPPKTSAFWEIVDANRGSEESELADIVDNMRKQIGVNDQGEPVYGNDSDASYTRDGYPKVLTLQEVAFRAPDASRDWWRDQRNRRVIPKKLERIGYLRVLNDDADDQLWKIAGRRQAIYGRFDLSLKDRLDAVRELINRG